MLASADLSAWHIVKACGCGRTYTLEQWSKLRYRFRMDTREADEDPPLWAEFRDCERCGSTIAVEEHLLERRG